MSTIANRVMNMSKRLPSARHKRMPVRQAWTEHERDDDTDSEGGFPVVRPQSATSKISDDVSKKQQWNKLKGMSGSRPSSTRGSRLGLPSHRSTSSRGGHLAPPRLGPSSRRGSYQDTSRSRPASSMTHRDELETETAAQQQQPRIPQTAWEAFEDHIMDIDDSQPFYNRNFRHFPSSDTFKHTLTDINYTAPVPILAGSRRTSDADIDSVIKVNVRINDDDTYLGDVTSQYGDDPMMTSGRSISPVSMALDEDAMTIGEDRSRSGMGMLGRATPMSFAIDEDLTEEPANEHDQVKFGMGTSHGGQDVYAPASDVSRDPNAVRQELYQRYLDKPDTWAKGLKKYLVRTVIRERVTSSSNIPHNAPIGFRPKTLSGSEANLLYPSHDQRGAGGWGQKSGRPRVTSACTTIPDRRSSIQATSKNKTRRRAATATGKLVSYSY